MGQYMKQRTPTRLEWLGDMEPEYETMMEWLCRLGDRTVQHPQEKIPVSWVVMANALQNRATHQSRG